MRELYTSIRISAQEFFNGCVVLNADSQVLSWGSMIQNDSLTLAVLRNAAMLVHPTSPLSKRAGAGNRPTVIVMADDFSLNYAECQVDLNPKGW
jgi:L-aminopeptidase/D-esterase-like protein